MTRQEELNEAWCRYRNKCSTEIMQALAFALRWADSNPQWISVVDELPPLNGFIGSKSIPVFAVREHKDYVDVGICAYDYEAKDWDTLENVTHWMPLPAPPLVSVLETSASEKPTYCGEKGGEE